MVLLLLNIANGQISEESSLPMFDYKFKGTIFDFTHRSLSPKEIKAYDSLIKKALDPSKRLARVFEKFSIIVKGVNQPSHFKNKP